MAGERSGSRFLDGYVVHVVLVCAPDEARIHRKAHAVEPAAGEVDEDEGA